MGLLRLEMGDVFLSSAYELGCLSLVFLFSTGDGYLDLELCFESSAIVVGTMPLCFDRSIVGIVF